MHERAIQWAHVKLIFEDGTQYEGAVHVGILDIERQMMTHAFDGPFILSSYGPIEWSMELQGAGKLTVTSGVASVMSPLGWACACRYCGLDLIDVDADRCPRCTAPTPQWWARLKARAGIG